MTTSEQSLLDWLVTTIAAIEEMDDSRHLVRSRDGRMIHRDICRHARHGTPWLWADTATKEQIIAAVAEFSYGYCLQCTPAEVL